MELISKAYLDDNSRPYANQTINRLSIGDVIGRIRNIWNPNPPERIRTLIGYALAADWGLRLIDRIGRILDTGDVITGVTTAITTSSSADVASWLITNVVILGIAGYLLWPVGKQLMTAIHKLVSERYTQRKTRPNAEAHNG